MRGPGVVCDRAPRAAPAPLGMEPVLGDLARSPRNTSEMLWVRFRRPGVEPPWRSAG